MSGSSVTNAVDGSVVGEDLNLSLLDNLAGSDGKQTVEDFGNSLSK